MTRQCGDCQLCCKLLPMSAASSAPQTLALMVERGMMPAAVAKTMTPDFYKPAGERCPHQRHHKGCMIYGRRPFGCRMWSCRWLTGDDTAELRRPDHSHYVVDIAPDFVRIDPTGGNNHSVTVPVVQVWIDSGYPDAHTDPALRAFLLRRAQQERMAALIRLSSSDAFLLTAPPLSDDGRWHEQHSATTEHEHTAAEKLAAIGPMKIILEAK